MNNAEIEKTIKQVKVSIEKSRNELAEARGQKKILLSTLKKDFDIENLLDAEDMVQKLTREIESLSFKLENKYTELKEKYNFI